MTRQQCVARLRAALSILLEAYEYSEDEGSDPWDFALEIDQLRSLGLNNSDFRWLSGKGYVEHQVETTRFTDDQRAFQRAGKFNFEARSCFVLTPAGVAAARSDLAGVEVPEDNAAEANPSSRMAHRPHSPAYERPFWDGERRELWFRGRLVKQFRRPAANQEAILAAFEEEGWPSCISDPIPQDPDIDAKRRLNDAIKALNRHQAARLLRFKGDGTAEGVIWEPIDGARPQGGHQTSSHPERHPSRAEIRGPHIIQQIGSARPHDRHSG